VNLAHFGLANFPVACCGTSQAPLPLFSAFVVGDLGNFLQKEGTCLLIDNYQCKDISIKVRTVLGEIVRSLYIFQRIDV